MIKQRYLSIGRSSLIIGSIISLWILYVAIISGTHTFYEPSGHLSMFGRRCVVALFGVIFTWITYLIMRQFESKSVGRFLASATILPLFFTIILGVINFIAFYVVSPLDWVTAEMAARNQTFFHLLYLYSMSWGCFVTSWPLIYMAITFAARTSYAERRLASFIGVDRIDLSDSGDFHQRTPLIEAVPNPLGSNADVLKPGFTTVPFERERR